VTPSCAFWHSGIASDAGSRARPSRPVPSRFSYKQVAKPWSGLSAGSAQMGKPELTVSKARNLSTTPRQLLCFVGFAFSIAT